MATVLADIGGTHARFAMLESGKIVNPKKLSVDDFKDIQSALQSYCGKPCTLMIATAAQPDNCNMWRITNNKKWIIDPALLNNAGWDVKILINDFAASARGALVSEKLVVLREGYADEQNPRAVIGPGTGLGLAYMTPAPGGNWHIQQTFGGHMKAAMLTSEQHAIANLVQQLHGDNHVIIYEDLASGRALPLLYRAICLHNGAEPVVTETKDMLNRASDANVKQALRLFHEFLGLFAHNVVVTGHAFGGLYIDGGVTHRLFESGLFDFESFAKFMAPNVTRIVKERLESTPVFIVNDPFVALRGLAEMAKNGT